MKNMKKLIALLLTFTLVMAMGIGAMAAPDDEGGDPAPAAPAYDYPLTVTGLSVDEDGNHDTVKFYQVVEWVGETADKSDVSGWKAVSAYSSVLTKDVLKSMLVGDPDADPAVAPTGMTSEIAGQLAKLATGGVDATSYSADGKTATLENATSGMWMALVTPVDADTVYNPVFVSADYNKETGHEGTVAVNGEFADGVAKSSTVTLTKTASTSEDNWDDGKPTTTAVGDTVNFTVTTTIPGYGDVYTAPHFAVTDTLTALELDTDSVVVANLEKGEDKDYTVSATASGYTITFTEKYLKSLKAATSVTITYSAVVTVDAVNAVNEENNEVSIEYSHNPNNQGDYDVKKDTTQHYTFSLDASGIGKDVIESLKGKKTSEIVKIGKDAAGKPITETRTTSEIGDPEKDYVEGPLQGAVFGLFTDSEGKVPYKDKDGNNVTAESGTDGRMNFKGLDAGTYYLKEISAPAGYVTNSTVHTVVIAAETESVSVTEWWNGSAWVSEKPAEGTAKEVTYDTDILKSYTVTIDGKETAKYTFTNNKEPHSTEIQWDEAELIEHPFPFDNTQGTELPSTGGIGTTMFYIVGSVLVLGAAVLLISKRRMNVR
jgi:fimbrial isopeptide formation D2 family protein/LPXTG-motif cell wall-anchored protein